MLSPVEEIAPFATDTAGKVSSTDFEITLGAPLTSFVPVQSPFSSTRITCTSSFTFLLPVVLNA